MSAYQRGVWAYRDGKMITDNPYETGEPERFEWARGYMDAKDLDPIGR